MNSFFYRKNRLFQYIGTNFLTDKYANLSKNSSVRSRTDSVYSTMSVQDELKSVLEVFREKDKHLDIVKTPEIYISQDSNPAEVRKWLKAKNFSQR